MMNFSAFAGAEHRPFTLEGGPTAALLVHGFPGTPAEMRPLAEALHAQAGWTVHAPLLPGFGADIETLPQRRHQEWIAAVRDGLMQMQQRYTRVILVGFSMGGAVALNVALETPPDALVLLNPLSRMASPIWGLLPVVKRVIPQFKPFRIIKVDFSSAETRKSMAQFMPGADFDDPAVQEAIRSFAIPTAMFDELRQVGESAYRGASAAPARTFVIQASRDVTVSPAMTHKLVKRLPPSAQFVELEAEHMMIKPGHDSFERIVRLVINYIL